MDEMITYDFVAGLVIENFGPGGDSIRFPADADAARFEYRQVGADLLVGYDGLFMTLLNTNYADLTSDHFQFYPSGSAFFKATTGDDNFFPVQDGNDYLDISNGGNDTVWAGAGADVIDVGAAFNSGDAILGDTPGTTSAIDTLRIAGEYDQAVVFGAGTVFSIEKYEIGSGGTVRLTLLDDGLFAGVDNMAAYPRFDASGQTSGDAFILDASAITIGQNGYYASITAFGGAGNDYLATGAGNDTISSGAGDDTLHGNSGNDTLSGGDGADSLSGGDGADVLDGGAGADSLSGDAGNDTLDGGSEMDTLLGGDGADLLTGGAGEDLLAGDWGNDTLDGGHDMDTLNGGDGADLLTGGAGADYLFGEGGNDTVDGGAGNDLIAADPGNNTYLFGRGDGQDVVYYSGTDGFNTLQLKAGVQTSDIVVRRAYDVFLGDNQALEVSIYGTSDKIVFNRPYEDTPANPFSVQQIRFADGTVWNVSTIVNRLNVGSPGADTLRGSAAADMIYGDAGDDDLSGGDGHDYINGGEGADTVAGEAGFDVLNGDAGNDSMVGGAGDDSLNGGEGDDTADGGAGNDTFNDGYGSNVYLFGKGDGQDLVYFSSDFTWGKLSTLQFKPNVLPSEVVLTQVYDQLYGDMAALEVSIAGTTDKIYFHNFLVVDNPNGEYYNNVRNNSVHQFRFDDGTVWDLATIASKLARSTDGNDTMLGTVFADVIDGQAGDDNLNGLAGDDSLIGGEGADILIGDAGSDSLRGGAGNDSLDGGAGDDVYLFGRGDGQDRVNYSYDPTAGKLNTLQLKSGVASSEVVLKLVYDDTFYRNSALEVSIAGTTDKIVFNGFLLDDDTATPYNSVQQIRFDDGSVWDLATIVNKVLAGTDEADTVRGTLAADALDGAAGNDNLNGLAGNDTLIGGEGADTLTGEHGDDSLVGGAGLDGLDGGAGNDTLDGGAGEDHLFGGDGDDVFLFGKGDGQDRIYHAYDPAAGKLNTLQLKAGVATSELVLKQVYDDVFGDNGALEISIAGTTDKVVIIGFLYTGDAANPYNSVQQISFDDGTVWNLTTIVSKLLAGTDGNDSTLGTLSADLIDGAAGDDNLNGLAGDDTLLGGEGADTLMGDAGSDSLIGGAGNDSIDGGAGDDTLDGGAGNDTLAGGDGNNVYRFGIGDGQDMMNIAVDFAAGKLNTLQLKAGVAVSDVMLAQVQDNMFGGNGALEVSLAGTTDKITFNGFLYGNDTNNPFNGLQQIRFDDGTVWNLATITSKLFSSTDSDDTRVGTAAADLLDGAGGNDNLNGAAGDDTLLGGEGADTLTGDAGSDSLTGGAGNDSLDGGADADILDGGAGNDTVNGGYGDNVYLFGKGDGQDRVSSTYDATAGKLNTLQLKAGVLSSELVLRQVYDDAFGGNRALEVSIAGSADKLTFNGFLQGDDAAGPYNGLQQIRFDDGTVWNLATIVAKTLAGTEGADSTRGSVASDLIDGAGGDDELNGAAGDDTLSGGEGADTLVGDGGADLLAGGAGNDSLDGGDNADTLDGGAGNDTLNGGPGDNAYLFGKGDGQDRIAVTYDPTGKLNTLQLKAGVLSSEVVVKQVYDDYFGGLRALEVSIAGTTDKVTINGFLQGDDTASPYNGLQQIRFDDGTVWNLDTIVGKTLASTEGGDTTRGTVASEAIDGAGGDDYLNGAAGDDTLTGGEGADTLSGEDGDDLLSGGAGNDSLDGGHYGSGDTLDGGAGNDILNGGLGENVYLFGKGDGQDQFTVYYDATSKLNTLQLKAGVLSSEIVVKQVYDDYFGGKRALEVSIAGTADKVTINGFLYGDDAANPYNGLQQIRFDDGTVWNLDTIVGMTLASTEGNDTTRGTVASDTLYGAGGNDELNGAAGDDSLSGGEGADTLSGEDWSDVLDGGAGNDSLDGGADADTLDGGAGNDTLNGGYGDNLYLFGKGDGQDRIAVFNDPTAGKLNTLQLKPGVLATELVLKRVDDDYFGGDSALEVSIAGSTDKLTVNGFFLNDDTAKSYNGVQQIRFDDGTIWDLATIENNLFDGEPKVLDGTAGDDTLTGAAGDDTLSGADGNDVLNGDLGNDSLAGGAGNDSLAGGAGNDVQFGGGDNDVLNGETGADALYGGSGDDVLDGGGDADLLFGGSGADVLNGGDDADQLYAQGPDDAIGGTGAVDLAGTVNVLNGGAGNDILRGGFGDDQLNGQVGNDDLHDEDGGNDSLDGGDGDDLLNGGQGNDSLEGGEGMDTLFGGTGDNSAVDADSLSGGAGDDVLVTGAAANGSARGTATDTLDGGAGNDVLYAGSDFRSDRAIMTGGAGADRFVLGNYGSHTLGDDLGAAAFGNFSQIGSAVFSNVAMPDRITDFTQSEGDLLRTGVINGFGGAGMPIVWRGVAGGGFTATLGQSIALASGGTSEARFLELWTSYDAGSDTTILFMDRDRDGIVGENDFKLEFDGELVLDKASFTPGTFADFKFGTGGADSDTGVALSNGNDFAFGYAGNDTLDGLDGNDILNGDQGSDSLSGGNGDDVIFGGAGDDAAVGGAGNDMLFGGSGADTLDGGEGADRMHADGADDVIGASGAGAAGSVEVLNGGAGNDLLVAGAGDAALNGQADNDTLIGGAGDDTLDGGEGADLLGGQGGDDVLDGGAGADGMSGGDGADTYFVDEAGDFVVEGDGAGSGQADHVNSYLAEYTLGANVENGRILSAAAANLAGNELDNILYAGSGDNVLAGAGGTDTVSYAHGGAGVVVDLNITGGQGTWGSGVDALSGIENLVGTAFADTLGGDSGANVLAGGAGDDVLDGGAGDDAMLGGDGADTYHVRQAGDTVVETNTANSAAETDLVFSHLGFYALAENVENGRIVSASGASITGNALDNTLYAGIGNNQLDGGAGNDTVSYLHATSSAGVAVSLALAGAQATGSSGSDTLSNVENLVGTDYADTLTGNAGANALTGGLGNDVLDGGSGADTMSGGDGADSYHVSETADVVIETDAAVGAAQADMVYSAASDYTLGANVEDARITSGGAANLSGNALDNIVHAGTGNNVLDGGTGADTLSYAFGAGSGVAVSLALTGAQATGGSGTDTVSNFENLVGTAFADTLTGDNGANALTGAAGNDVLDGGAGNDTMSGGDGADTYHVREAGDVVAETNASAGGAETDLVASYLATYTLGANVENGRVMSAAAANLVGNSLDNILYAGSGDNVLLGAGGIDTASYADAAAGVTVSLAASGAQATGGSGSDTLAGVENLVGTAFADALTGSSGANALTGGAGNDVLDGGAGADTMSGGDGADTYYVGDAGDMVVETNATGGAPEADLVVSNLAAYTLGANVENGRILGAGPASLTGNALANILYAGSGDNALDGAAGTDTVSYAFGAAAGVTVSLALAGAQATGGSGSDTLTAIENLDGTAFADSLTGSSAANALTSGAGNDLLNGGAGVDTLTGGDGADIYFVDDAGDVVVETNATVGAAELDVVNSSAASYTLTANVENGRILNATAANLTGNAMNNVLFAGSGANVVDGAAGVDTLSYAFGAASGVTVSLALAGAQATGGSGSDTLAGIENLVGTAFADTLTGDGAANALTGAAGNDVLDGGAGNDTMSGGDGADTYYVSDAGDSVVETNATASGAETDMVYSTAASYTLTANVENARITSAGAANLFGNTLNNFVYAGTGDNILNGGAGVDTLSYAFDAGSGVSVSLLLAVGQATGGSGTDTVSNFENLIGTDYADSFTGNSVANVLTGAAGNDVLNGGAGNDTMSGGDGADTYHVHDAGDVVIETNAAAGGAETDLVVSYLANYTLGENVENGRVMGAFLTNLTGNSLDNILYAGSGNNVLNGAGGIDTASYADAGAGVTVSLALTAGQATGGSGWDTLAGFENLAGTAFADTLTGDGLANALTGAAGDDVLDGGAGDDTMSGGDGADTYNVSEAGDVVVETNAAVDAAEADLVLSNLAAYTLGANVENGRIMGAGLASLTGNALANVLYAGSGDNALDGAAGTDTVSYAFGAAAGVTVSLALAGAQATGGSGSDTLTGIENLVGTAFTDTLTGSSAANALTTGAGNDVLNGGAGADTMTGGDGSDSYYVDQAGDVVVETNTTVGGAETDVVYSFAASYTLTENIENGRILSNTAANLTGNAMDNVLFAGTGANVIDGAAGVDTLSYLYSLANTGVTVSLALAGAQATGGSGADTLINIENLIGTAYADTLSGNAGANVLTGAAGNDVLDGGAGNDTLDGGVGNDTMSGGDGADTYHVSDAGDSVVETNASASGAETDMVLSTAAGYTLTANVENARISSTGAANLTGNTLDNIVYAGTGANLIDGAAGVDTVSYAFGAASGVTVNLSLASAQATGGSGSDTLTGIENLIGTAFADSLTGDGLANALAGGAGNDVLDGGAGNDTMTGGDGADTYYVGEAGDVVVETNAAGDAAEADLVMSNSAAYTLGANVENGRILGAGLASLTGNALGNILYAGAGNNALDGAAGIDTVSYAFGAATGVTVSLALAGAQATGGSGSDTLAGIENLVGTAFADTLSGDGLANALTGAAGNDVLDGGAGDDTMSGGDGADTYHVGEAGDVVVETNATASAAETDMVMSNLAAYTLTANVENGRILGTGAANLSGNAQNNILYAGAGDNVLDGAAGVDTVSYAFGAGAGVTVSLALAGAQATGGSGSDTLAGIENLIGTAFVDSLTGSSGANALTSGAGNDLLNGGAGADTMTGGDGADSYFVSETGDVVVETNATVSAAELDIVYSSAAAYTLTANVENGRILNATAANLTGNAMNNVLFAGSGANVIDGAAGVDTLSYAFGAATGVTVSLALAGAQATGGSGTDTLAGIENLNGTAYDDNLTGDAGGNVLMGGGGNDVLTGGLGADFLSGGAGADIFSFLSIADSGLTSGTWDTISDFVQGIDKIDLSGLDANGDTVGNDAFTSMIASNAAFTTAGQLRIVDGVLYGNTDGDADAEFAIVLTGVTTLTLGDFLP